MAKPVFIENYKRNPSNVLTVGTFDGVHLGHQALLRNVVKRARSLSAPAVVVTFDPHPRDVITPSHEGIRMLTNLHERAAIMNAQGIDQMIVIPFNRDFSMLSSESFVRNYIYEQIGVHTFVIGYDHHFGRDREGSIQTLKALSDELGFSVYVEKAHEVRHTTVSSSAIRRLLEEKGDVETAAEMLGRPYEMSGRVIKGDQRGRNIGFPTANLEPENKNKVIPAKGVYCVEAHLDREVYHGMMNIGVRPTFKGDDQIIPEVYLFNFSRTIYGSNLRIRFFRRIRGEKKFSDLQELIEQLIRDRDNCMKQSGI